jgi:hypothetical protein
MNQKVTVAAGRVSVAEMVVGDEWVTGVKTDRVFLASSSFLRFLRWSREKCKKKK